MGLVWKEEGAQGYHYILGIGIDTYTRVERLHSCEKDIHKLQQFLLERFQFDASHCQTLLNEAATKAGIIRALQRLAQILTEQDSLLIHFSGHGSMLTTHPEGYLLAYDGNLKKTESLEAAFLTTSELVFPLLSIKARHVLLMIDSGIKPYQLSEAAKGLQPDLVIQDRGMGGSLAELPSRWGIDASGLESKAGGIFVNHLIDTLAEATNPKVGIGTIMASIRQKEDQAGNRHSIYGAIPELGDKGGEYHFYLNEQLLAANQAITQLWAETKLVDTPLAYQQFMEAYPTSNLCQQARVRLQELDLLAWGAAIQADNPNAFATYIASFPAGIFVEQAHKRKEIAPKQLNQSDNSTDDLTQQRAAYALALCAQKKDYEQFISLFPAQLALVKQAKEAIDLMAYDIDLAFIATARGLITDGEMRALFEALIKRNAPQEIRDEVSLQSAAWARLARDHRVGMVDYSEYSRQAQKITGGIQLLLAELEKRLLD